MNKADLVNLVSAATETKTVVSSVVDTTIETIVDSVVEGKVSILGFGSFEPRDRSAED